MSLRPHKPAPRNTPSSKNLSSDPITERERLWIAQRQKRVRQQTLLFLVAILVLWAVLRITRLSREAESKRLAQHFTGTWELESLGAKTLASPNSEILSQKATFENNRATGETRIRANTPAGTDALPFPDKSARTVEVSLDGKEVTVKWRGTYEILSGGRITLKFGSSTNTVQARWDAVKQRLLCDHDFILIYPEAAQYHPAALGYSAKKPR